MDALEKPNGLLMVGRAVIQCRQEWISGFATTPFQEKSCRRREDTSRAAVMRMGFSPHEALLLQELNHRRDRVRIGCDTSRDFNLSAPWSDHDAAEDHELIGRDAVL